MPSDDIARLHTYTAGTDIESAKVNAEHNQFVSTCNGKAGRDVDNTFTGANTFSGVNSFTATPLTNQINERTSGSGVTIDSVLHKDGMVTLSGTPTTTGQVGYTSNNLLFHNGSGVKTLATTDGLNSTLEDLTDVTITGAATGDFLRHNGTAWVDDTPVWTGANQAITIAGTFTLAHGKGRAPASVAIWLECITAEYGYSVGAKLIYLNGGPTNESMGISVLADATNIKARYGNASKPFYVQNFSTGAPIGLTNANWECYPVGVFL